MLINLIAILCASGTILAYNAPQSVIAPEVTPPKNHSRNERPNRRPLVCPEGFVRLNRNCFYFSAGTANWLDAHFHCKDRNSTLATLTKKHMDRKLRNFLQGPQLKQLERWIGVRYNWGTMTWEWGVTGEILSYNGFGKLRPGSDELYQWHCAAMNPEWKYRWAARSCIENKHYVCQTPAKRSGRRRGKLPGGQKRRRNQVPLNKNRTASKNLIDRNDIAPYRRPKWRPTKRSRPDWNNGMKMGIRPPSTTRWAPGTKFSDRLKLVPGKGSAVPDQWVSAPKIISEQKGAVGTEDEKFAGAFRAVPRTLAGGTDNRLGQLNGRMSSLFTEEVLLKTSKR
ncbi:uncharacterized protein LOC105687537 [Athalia rosae]|uniref:uncharacterized protein LOC105687537 n=1 Tax=Athalia rosae TaxID=37344 RepID=UPI002033B475|nr:uncharacterized protein LOC105687537 [Athalia rosae]